MAESNVAWGIVAITLVMFVVGALSNPIGRTGAREPTVNTTEIATAVHAEINDARRAHGVAALTYSERTQATAAEHSTWMADTGSLNHSARGTYACEYAGENIAYTYADGNIRISETETVDLNNNETRIAERLVNGWLNSSAHRQNILDEQFDSEGIGIATATVDGRERVYATQGLCG